MERLPSQDYRLGLDLGTNSIGWAILGLSDGAAPRPVALIDCGTRIFADGRNPKDKTSLAVARRMARSMRRRRDRYLRRRRKLLRALVELGLMPQEPDRRAALAALNPYEIRARALHEPVPLHHLGRALFHLNQRRGFKSNRKTDAEDDAERGKIREGMERLRQAMAAANAATLGEFLFRKHAEGEGVRVRLKAQATGNGKTQTGYDLYPERTMVMEEFDALWSAQAPHHPAVLTQAARDRLWDIIFFQRRLKPVRPGRCTLVPEEERLARAHPLFQRRRVYEQANSLEIIGPDLVGRPLSRAQRDMVAEALLANPKRTFAQLRRLLKLPPDCRFNLESETRKDLKGDETTAALSREQCLGSRWRSLSMEDQAAVVQRLLDEQEEKALIAWLAARLSVDADHAERIARARLPDGYGNLGLTATRKIVAALEAHVITYDKAVALAGYHHSDFCTGKIHNSLPYYGRVLERHVAFGTGDPDDPEEVRYGRLANPTVHIALGQLRRIVNTLIARYGPPRQIIVELARELKLNKRQLKRVEQELRDNTARAERHRRQLAEIGLPDSGENRLRLRLWEELNLSDPFDRRCPYSGEVISLQRLFSGEVDIDHILPFSRTLDNSVANKTVALRRANREKGNRTPYEAFGHSERWADLAKRAETLPRNKRWRFAPDAIERFETEERDFLARHLTDTQYLSRIAREYLATICDPTQVWVTPGRLTELLRRSWGLNQLLPDHNLIEVQNRKNRLDHRHHAIDAAVVGVTDRGLLNRVSRAAAEAEAQDLDRLVAEMPLPFPDFRDQLDAALRHMTVSHRPDHGTPGTGDGATAGRLHNDTAYGLAGVADKRGARLVVHRVPLESLSGPKDIAKVRDRHLRAALAEATAGLSGRDFVAALTAFAERDGPYKGTRRVRIEERLSVIPIADRNGRPYKAYKGDANHRFDVWRLPDGRWAGEVVSMFDAHQAGYRSPIKESHPTARKLLRLHKHDLLAVETTEGRRIMRVVKLSTTGVILAPHNEGGALKARDADREDYFKYLNTSASGLQKLGARQVRIDALGRVFDPGHLA